MLSAFVAHRSSYTTTSDSYSFLVQRSAFPSSLLSLATLTQETLGCGDERKSGESERETKFLGGLGLLPRPFLFPTRIFFFFFFKGADVNATTDYDGRTPLHIACVEGNTEAVEFLLAKGAITQVRDRFKCSPLDDAIKFRHKEIVKTLRKAGAQLMKSSMETAVELCRLAAKNRVDDLLVWQLAGADFNASDYDKRTPLHVVSLEKKCRQ